MPLFCQPGNAEHLSIWLKGPLEASTTTAASLSGTKLPRPPQNILTVLVPTQPPPASTPCPILSCCCSPGSRAAGAGSCLSPAPWGTFVPLWEENQNLWNCACSRCLAGNARSGPRDRCWGWVRAVPRGCVPHTGVLQNPWCGKDAWGTTWPMPPGAGTRCNPLPAPLHLSSDSW